MLSPGQDKFDVWRKPFSQRQRRLIHINTDCLDVFWNSARYQGLPCSAAYVEDRFVMQPNDWQDPPGVIDVLKQLQFTDMVCVQLPTP